MRILAVIAMMVSVSGCSWLQVKPQPPVIKYKYVVPTVPAQMFEVPPPTPSIDTNTATDKDAANWIVESEKRSQEIEKRLNSVKDYLDNKVKSLKVPPEDIIMN